MSVNIAQDKEQVRLAYSIQSRASMHLMSLAKVSATCKKNIEDIASPLKFLVNFETDKPNLTGRRLAAPVQFILLVTDNKDLEVVSIECAFRAEYDLIEGYLPSPEEMHAFSQSNAVFNCWPYFRELAQTTLSRMNYPPLSIPFLRLVPKASPPPVVQTPLLEAQSEAVADNASSRKGRKRVMKSP